MIPSAQQPALARLEDLIREARTFGDDDILVSDLEPVLADLAREHEALKQELHD